MTRSSRKTKRQQTQKSITPFTVSNVKMANDGVEETASSEAITLLTLRHKLQTHRDEIKAEIGSLCRVLKGEITTLHSETKADMKTLHEELTGELAKLCTAQAEANSQLEDMGTTLSETMDRVETLEKTQQELAKKCKYFQEKCLDLENRSRRQNLRIDSTRNPGVHRSLAPMPSSADRPRTIVVCFHYYTDKQKVLDTAWCQGEALLQRASGASFPRRQPGGGKDARSI